MQRWSQPFCTWTKARVRPVIPSIRCAAVLAHGRDVVNDDLLALADAESLQLLPGPGLHLFVIAHDLRHFRHGGEGPGLDLRGATGDG